MKTKALMVREVIEQMINEEVPFSFQEVRRRVAEKYNVKVVNATINNMRRKFWPTAKTDGSTTDVVQAVEIIRKVGDSIGWEQFDRIVAAVRR